MAHGLHLITKMRKWMRNRLLDLSDELLLRKRAIIETIKNPFTGTRQSDSTRHLRQEQVLPHHPPLLLESPQSHPVFPSLP